MSRYSGLCERDMRILWKRDGCGRTRQAAPLLLRPLPHRRHARAAGRAQRDTVRDDARRPVAALEARHTRRRHHQAAHHHRGPSRVQHRPGHMVRMVGRARLHSGRRTRIRTRRRVRVHRPRPLLRQAQPPDGLGQNAPRPRGRQNLHRDQPLRRRAAHLGTLRAPRRRQDARARHRRGVQPRPLHDRHRPPMAPRAGHARRPHVPVRRDRKTPRDGKETMACPRRNPPSTACPRA